jgi:hypothetical protein
LHGNGTNGSTTITDSSRFANTVTAVGNAQISTAQSKFGGASIAFDGNGDYLTIPASEQMALGRSDFTIEMFLRFNVISTSMVVYDAGQTAGPVLYVSSTNQWLLFFTDGNKITASSPTVTADTWHHFAWTRSGSDSKLFLNGTQIGSTYTDTTNYSSPAPRIGARFDATLPLNGYIDEFRITKGICRYQSTFTPPTAPFPDI